MPETNWIARRHSGGHSTYATAEHADSTNQTTLRGLAMRFPTEGQAKKVFADMNPGEQALWETLEVHN